MSLSPRPLPVVPVILCGGSGTRLWPLSRQSFPKQFLTLAGESSLLQSTLRRCAGITAQAPMLLTQEASRFIVGEQLREIGIEDFTLVLEPTQRGTAAALVCAALCLRERFGDALMLALPSDHLLRDMDEFVDAAKIAVDAAHEGWLMTFGVRPDTPETGYGYLRAGQVLEDRLIQVSAFIEKPDRERAEHFLASGDYYWNSGMFVFRCSQLLEEIAGCQPLMREACELAVSRAVPDQDFLRLDPDAYAATPALSIDHALMEHTASAAMVPIEAGWSDIGSWSSVWDTCEKDPQGNATRGEVLLDRCESCLVMGGERLIAAVGLTDVVVVDTPDALLVMNRQHAQETRHIVARLQASGRSEAAEHRCVHRPWGEYDAMGRGPRFQVKRITVRPGARLSLQMHHHRAEHWIVVSGTARVTRGDESFLLGENQSAYIEVGMVHSLENPGKIPLELIEVQSGSYLGEDDIVRLSDCYGRR